MSSHTASVLVEPFGTYLTRRADSAVALTAGEAVTAAVALLRGCRRASGRACGTRWWLRADGCPVAEDDDDGQDAVAATADMLLRAASVADDDASRDMLTRARESVLTRPPREWEALERRLFQHADPEPLILGPLTPVAREAAPAFEHATPGSAGGVLALIDADLGAAVGEVLRDLRARWRTSRAVRLGLIATVSALVVVVIAVVWPQPPERGMPVSDPSPRAGVPSGTASGAATEPGTQGEELSDLRGGVGEPTDAASVAAGGPSKETERGTVSPSPADPVASDDPVAAARALITRIAGCAGDSPCIDTFAESSSDVRDPLPPDAADAELQLIDDYGGVGVVRLTSGATSQYVTLVRHEDRWLVRDVRTIADQPS